MATAISDAIDGRMLKCYSESNKLKHKIVESDRTTLAPCLEQMIELRQKHNDLEQELIAPLRRQIAELERNKRSLEHELEEWYNQRTFAPYMQLPSELRMEICSCHCLSQVMDFFFDMRCVPCLRSIAALLPLAQVSSVVRKELWEVAADHLVPLKFEKSADDFPNGEYGLCKETSNYLCVASDADVADLRHLQILPSSSALPFGSGNLALTLNIAEAKIVTWDWSGPGDGWAVLSQDST